MPYISSTMLTFDDVEMTGSVDIDAEDIIATLSGKFDVDRVLDMWMQAEPLDPRDVKSWVQGQQESNNEYYANIVIDALVGRNIEELLDIALNDSRSDITLDQLAVYVIQKLQGRRA